MKVRLTLAALAAVLAATVPIGGAQAASTSFVSCEDIMGSTTSGTADHTRVVLGVVSVPPSRIQSGQYDASPPWKYFAKWGLEIHTGNEPVVVTVPVGWTRRMAISWGPSGAFSEVRFQACRRPGGLSGSWNGYAGGFYLQVRDECVPLTVRVGRRSQTVHVGIGETCSRRYRAPMSRGALVLSCLRLLRPAVADPALSCPCGRFPLPARWTRTTPLHP